MRDGGQPAVLSPDTTNHCKASAIALATPVTAARLPIRQRGGSSEPLPAGGLQRASEGGGVEPAACSNLVPVRSGSLIPDYGSLGLRHADAQFCAHLQATDLNLALLTGHSRLLPRERRVSNPNVCRRNSLKAPLPFGFGG